MADVRRRAGDPRRQRMAAPRRAAARARRRRRGGRPGTNLGFAGGMNLGIRGRSTRATAVMMLNDDVVVEHGWLAPLVSELADERVGAVQPKLLFDGDPPTINSLGVALGRDGAGTDIGMHEPDDPTDVTRPRPRRSSPAARCCSPRPSHATPAGSTTASSSTTKTSISHSVAPSSAGATGCAPGQPGPSPRQRHRRHDRQSFRVLPRAQPHLGSVPPPTVGRRRSRALAVGPTAPLGALGGPTRPPCCGGRWQRRACVRARRHACNSL